MPCCSSSTIHTCPSKPASDNGVIVNSGEAPLWLVGPNDDAGMALVPRASKEISPRECWVITMGDGSVVHLRVLPRPEVHTQKASGGHSSVAKRTKAPNPTQTRAKKGELHTRQAIVDTADDSTEDDTALEEPCAGPGNQLVLYEGQAADVPAVGQSKPYRLVKHSDISQRKHSSVYVAELSHLARLVVVKIYKTDPMGGDNNRLVAQAGSWRTEFLSQGNLKHRSIVASYGGDARFLSLFFEYVQDSDLASSSVRNEESNLCILTQPQAQRIWLDMSDALTNLHEQLITHADIKPSNILFNEERGAVLCDFGLASTDGERSGACGTPWYVPFEFLTGSERGLGPERDVWALGITMLYVLGDIPLPGTSTGHHGWAIEKVGREQEDATRKMAAWVRYVSDAITKLKHDAVTSELLVRMLERQPSRRIEAQELSQRLAQYLVVSGTE